MFVKKSGDVRSKARRPVPNLVNEGSSYKGRKIFKNSAAKDLVKKNLYSKRSSWSLQQCNSSRVGLAKGATYKASSRRISTSSAEEEFIQKQLCRRKCCRCRWTHAAANILRENLLRTARRTPNAKLRNTNSTKYRTGCCVHLPRGRRGQRSSPETRLPAASLIRLSLRLCSPR